MSEDRVIQNVALEKSRGIPGGSQNAGEGGGQGSEVKATSAGVCLADTQVLLERVALKESHQGKWPLPLGLF